jgi:hypothetical protein
MLSIFKTTCASVRIQKRLLSFFVSLGLTFVGSWHIGNLPSIAQSPVAQSPVAQSPINRATLTHILDSPQVYIQDQQAKVNDSATQGQRIRTAAARAQVKFNTGAVGRIARNSVLTVGQQCARLQQGRVLVSGKANGCAASVIAGVRGTTYVMEMLENEAAQITVLEGTVTIAPSPDSNLPQPASPGRVQGQPSQANAPTALKSGDRVVIQPDGILEPVRSLTREEYDAVLTGDLFTGYAVPLSEISKIEQSYRALYPGQPFPKVLQSPPVRGLW